METQTAQFKAPESGLGAKPESKDDLKSLPMYERQASEHYRTNENEN